MSDSLIDHWISGVSVAPTSGDYFDDLNPLDDSVYARVALGSRQDLEIAVAAANDAFQEYRKTTPKQREQWLISAANLVQSHADDLINVLIDEVGSPVLKAKREIETATGILRAAAGATRQLSGKTLPSDVPGRLSLSIRQPLGVIAGITPFNVPLIKCIKHCAMPLATGNTVVQLPSEHAPVIANRVARLLSEAGFPAGAMNVVSGDGYQIGDALTANPNVTMVTFTGSVTVGKHIRQKTGELGKRCLLEMGGKNPLIVFDDADFQKAVQASVIGSFLYQGQICMSSSRIYVQQSIFESFVDHFRQATASLGIGDLRDPATMIGPIISSKQRSRIQHHLDDAIRNGAKVITGGEWVGNRLRPTILTKVPPNAICYREETFGPVTSVTPFDSAGEALSYANDSPYGLSASVFTTNLQRAMDFAQQIHAGMVHVNGTTIQDEPHVPFGGMGESGFGRESTDVDIESMTEWKWITIE